MSKIYLFPYFDVIIYISRVFGFYAYHTNLHKNICIGYNEWLFYNWINNKRIFYSNIEKRNVSDFIHNGRWMSRARDLILFIMLNLKLTQKWIIRKYIIFKCWSMILLGSIIDHYREETIRSFHLIIQLQELNWSSRVRVHISPGSLGAWRPSASSYIWASGVSGIVEMVNLVELGN